VSGDVTVLVGSVAGDGSLLRLLRSLPDVPVVVADRTGRGERASRRLRGDRLRWLPCPPRTPLAQLRRRALAAADTSIVAVVEDHSVAPRGWLARLVARLTGEVVAAAGPVRDLSRTTADAAAFACDYAPLSGSGSPGRLPGMNTAYRADALRSASRGTDPDGLWEGATHTRLADHGRFAWAPDAPLLHDSRATFATAATQRYVQGRLQPPRPPRALLTPALPLLLSSRTLRATVSRGRLAPHVGLLHLAGAAGELVGAIAGAGRAAQKLR